MSRPRKVDRPVRFEICLPTTVRAALDLELYSEIEGRVPSGKYSELVTTLIREWLQARGVNV